MLGNLFVMSVTCDQAGGTPIFLHMSREICQTLASIHKACQNQKHHTDHTLPGFKTSSRPIRKRASNDRARPTESVVSGHVRTGHDLEQVASGLRWSEVPVPAAQLKDRILSRRKGAEGKGGGAEFWETAPQNSCYNAEV